MNNFLLISLDKKHQAIVGIHHEPKKEVINIRKDLTAVVVC